MTRRSDVVTEDGAPRTLVGTPIGVGDRAPAFTCTVAEGDDLLLASFALADTPAVVRVFSVVPSLDTSVCAIQTTRFDAALSAEGGRVAAYTVSVDTPYAMHRFCRGAGVATVRSLSDYRPERSFGMAYGLLVEETGELARAVLVVDPDGVVRHAEIVADLYDHPDYDAALAAVHGLLAG